MIKEFKKLPHIIWSDIRYMTNGWVALEYIIYHQSITTYNNKVKPMPIKTYVLSIHFLLLIKKNFLVFLFQIVEIFKYSYVSLAFLLTITCKGCFLFSQNSFWEILLWHFQMENHYIILQNTGFFSDGSEVMGSWISTMAIL